VRAILRSPAFASHLLLSVAVFAAMFAAYTYLSAFLEAVAGFDGVEVALALLGFGLAGVLGNDIAGRIVERGPTAATGGAVAILGLATAAVSLAGDALQPLLPLLAIWGAAHTAIFVLCQVRVMLAGSQAKAFASSLNIAACNLGIALGAALGGWVVEGHGIGAIGFGSASLAGLALLLAAITARLEGSRMR
jgi:predicted MFS family arabinose efflux permease